MKISYLLFIVVIVLGTYLTFTAWAILQGNTDSVCNFWPDADCLEAKFELLTTLQKRQLLSTVHLDYCYLIFYPLLLGIWVYREMQAQASVLGNIFFRFCLLVVVVLFFSDITENILLGYALQDISYPFKTLALVTRLKWISFAFILLSLLIGVMGRKTGLFPLSLRLKNRIE
ncbi:heme A synthase [Runella defluvii]|uniref:Heme A synthase n=1 Tax=Runella defluvii TaxID=370973 RepID=A0A7W5ZUF1_9BACT|nr:hypothetical protein [Runella defluvii]MBB3842276.1 heme A synthase [Runella defluvii]